MTVSGVRVLISTISPVSGGVPAMVGFIAGLLEERGYQPVLAHYEPYSVSPQMSVPSFKLLRQYQIGTEQRIAMGRLETHAVGAWLPELEFTHYLPTRPWQKLIASCPRHIVISGSALAGMPFLATGRRFLAWIASGWEEDRKDRVATFSTPRRLIDRVVNSPVLRRSERRILKGGHILSLSSYTARTLDKVAGAAVSRAILPMPIDTRLFSPDPQRVVPWRIGFSGRIDDPRKNVDLLLAATGTLAREGRNVTLDLIGGEPNEAAKAMVTRVGLAGRVRFIPYMPQTQLAEHLSTLDVYVVPSHQEGLCIAALEAMASGCPVVTTRCGGPEDYVAEAINGALVDFDPVMMADAITRCAADRSERSRLASEARRTVETRFEREAAARVFWQHFQQVFGGDLREAA